MPFAPYKDCAIDYTVDGQGRGLVLVHGTAQTARSSWTGVLPHFTGQWTVVCPHYSGSGATRDNNERLSVPFLAEQVMAAAEHAGLECYDLVGHSLGTCVAMHIAAEYPEKVHKLVLLAGFLSTEDARMQLQFRIWRALAASNPEILAELFIFSAFSPAFISRFSDQQIKRFVSQMYSATDWHGAARQIEVDLAITMREQAKKILQPSLVIGCRQDSIVPVSHSHELAKTLPNAIYDELDAGHAALDEQAAEFTRMVKTFLLS